MHGFAGVLVQRDNFVLLVREPDYFTGTPYWTFPSGRIDEGEEPVTAAARELAEEAGCVLDAHALDLVAVTDVERDGETLNRSWTYAATTREIALQPRDHVDEIVTEARWVAIADAVGLLGQSSYAPKVEPAVRFLTTQERGLRWKFDLVGDSTPPRFRWIPPTDGLPA